MPWNDQSSGPPSGGKKPEGPWGGGPRRPWGQPPPRSPQGGQGPDLEDWLRDLGEKFRAGMGGGGGRGGDGDRKLGGGGRIGWPLIAGLLAAGWLLSGLYIVAEGQSAVITRFGAYERTTGPGLGLHLPYPFEARSVVAATRQRTHEIGCQLRGAACEDVPDESLMITGDRNIVQIHFRVSYNVSDPESYTFNVSAPDDTVRAVAESAMREVIGRRELVPVITRERASVETAVEELMQEMLNEYQSGMRVLQVELLRAAPPPNVVAAFNEVVQARQIAERAENEARGYANEVVPQARGEAARIVQAAEAYREQVVREANGEAARFNSVYDEYRRAPRVTRDRIYLETMERIYRNADTVIIDQRAGAVPYAPLDVIRRSSGAQAAPAQGNR